MSQDSSATKFVFFISESSTEDRVSVKVGTQRKSAGRKNSVALENAVYTYIQAVRALGRKQVNTLDIAEALSIPVSQVTSTLHSLKKKGVKELHV